MKALFPTIFIVLLVTNCFAQKKMTDREFDGLKGKVKTVEIRDEDLPRSAKAKTKEVNEPDFAHYYDEFGNMTESRLYSLGNKTIYFFIDGNKVSKTERFESGSSKNAFRITAIESPDKIKKTDTRYATKYKYDYDTQGHIVAEWCYSNDGSVNRVTKFRYNKAGILESSFENDPEEKYVLEEDIYKYDEKGNELEILYLTYSKDVKPIETDRTIHRFRNYKFDANGNWIQRTQTTSYTSNGAKKQIEHIAHRTITYY